MRVGYLILGAIVLALIAVGVLVWGGLVDVSKFSPTTEPGLQSTLTEEAEWANRIGQMATTEGIVGSFSDADIASWSITDGHRIERFRLMGPTQAFARLSSGHPLDPNDRLSGLQFKLPKQWADKVNGRRIEVGVLARQPQMNAASDVSVLYATLQAGNSGWHTFKITPEFTVAKFEFDVPKVDGGYHAEPLVVLRADSMGGGKAVELVGIYLKPASN